MAEDGSEPLVIVWLDHGVQGLCMDMHNKDLAASVAFSPGRDPDTVKGSLNEGFDAAWGPRRFPPQPRL